MDPRPTHDSYDPPKSIIQMANRLVSRSCTAHGRQSLYFTMGPFPPKLPLPIGQLDPHLTHCLLGPPESTTQMGPPESSTQTASWSVQPFLQGLLLWQTDSDHATQSLTIARIYVCSTVVRHNNHDSTLLKIYMQQSYFNSEWPVHRTKCIIIG